MVESKSVEKVRVVDPIDNFSAFIVRGAIIGAGVVGLTLWFRNSRFFAVYSNVRQIPEVYFSRGLSLKGLVQDVGKDGIIKVLHRPQYRLFSKKGKKNQGLLNLRLAGVNLSDSGIGYMSDSMKLEGRSVTFKLIKRDAKEKDAVDVDLSIKRGIIPINVNTDLIRRGYARVYTPDIPDHFDSLQSNTAYARLVTRLLTSEKVAERRGIGIWERGTWVESLRSYPSTFIQTIKASPVVKLVILFIELLKDFVIFLIYLFQRGVKFVEDFMITTRNGYASLTRSVENLGNSYLRLKSRVIKQIGK